LTRPTGRPYPSQSGPARIRPSNLSTGTEGLITVRTYSPKPADIRREWHVIDATDVVLGRLAAATATLLRGKHKAVYAPHMDTGDFVIIVNADKVALTGDKKTTKLAYRHSGYPGGLTATPVGELLEKDARKVVERAVWGMLPKNKLSRAQLRKLKVYSGPTHPHQAQKATPYEITQVSQ
jgi:large subunit ribosomal protein L13